MTYRHKRAYNRDEVTGMLYRAVVESGGKTDGLKDRIDSLMDVEDDPTADTIVVVHSFLIKENGFWEGGKTYWFASEQRANEYLEAAGRPVLGEENSYYDDPCEYRWNWVVVEQVTEGPMSMNKVLSWWRMDYSAGRQKGLERCKPPLGIENSFNFSPVG